MIGIKQLQDGWRRFDDNLNPIVVRELRQSVRGRFTMIALFLFLLLMLLTSAVVLSSDDISGTELAEIMFSILMVVCMMLVPIFFGVRSALEREREHMELLFISSLSPQRIVAGKLVAASMVSFLFFSAAAPFLTLTYFLRGIDVLTILMTMLVLFVVVVFMLQTAVFVGSAPTPVYMKILLGLGYVFFCFAMFGITYAVTEDLLRSGWGSFYERSLSNRLWLSALVFIAFTGGLFLLTTSLYKNPYHNPAFAPRLYFFILSALSLVAGAVWLSTSALEGLVFLVIFIGLVGFTVGICEEETPHRQMLAGLPDAWWPRMLLFPFYSGAMPALVWSFLMVTGALATFLVRTNFKLDTSFFEIALGLVLFTVFYGLSAFYLRRRLWPRFISRHWNWLLGLILCGFGMFIPWTLGVLFLSGEELWEHSIVFVLNPFALGRGSHRELLLGVVGLLGAGVTALQVPAVLRAIAQFKAPPPEQAKASFPPPRRGR
ncbi:hypothetical protein [Acanthopleuribacter pedis]|uniref:ABC transporter permease n=1 Tax=Acanthopleuribacter pedis TaxID=442870 RepID=A0A8J7QHD2_9BACT|nr:hypothetical protein [Acanthopleuribacter pedis]MBO1320486.1 hypothetical protein [Acanthopleuribacter pedis]